MTPNGSNSQVSLLAGFTVSLDGGEPLPSTFRLRMENLFGADFRNVRVHVTYQACEIGALAFTMGPHLCLAPGQYQPETSYGQQLLAHELAHVVQQDRRRVTNPFQSGVALVNDAVLEEEADWLGLVAARQLSCHFKRPLWSGISSNNQIFDGTVIQCKPIPLSAPSIFTDSRNKQLLMRQVKHNGEDVYEMPDKQLYRYIHEETYFDGDWIKAGLYKHVNSTKIFYDQVHKMPLHAFQHYDSRSAFSEIYYYEQLERKGDCFTYDKECEQFGRHDLISDFKPGDLLYGVEKERQKVRAQIEARANEIFMTADEIHKDIKLTSDQPSFKDWKSYEELLQSYKPAGKAVRVSYHPLSAASKSTKQGYKLDKGEVKLRRSCKALIYFMMERCDKQVHFILDNMTPEHGYTQAEFNHIKKYSLHSNTKLKFYRNNRLVNSTNLFA